MAGVPVTDDTDRVLASIDETIDGYVSEDWAVSGDAMRWQPEAPEQDVVTGAEMTFGVDYTMGDRVADWVSSHLGEGLELAGFQRVFLNQMYASTTAGESESDHSWFRERGAGWSDAWRQAFDGAWCASGWLDELQNRRVYVEGYRPSVQARPQWDDSLHASLNRTVESPPDGDSGWTDFGYTADGGFVYAQPTPRFNFGGLVPDPEAARRTSDELGRALAEGLEWTPTRTQIAEIVRALPPVGEILKAYGDRDHPRLAVVLYGDDYRRHRRTCRLCNPAGNPKPLPINGVEYRRRTRARRRRNRR
jgi:hypothetical protein